MAPVSRTLLTTSLLVLAACGDDGTVINPDETGSGSTTSESGPTTTGEETAADESTSTTGETTGGEGGCEPDYPEPPVTFEALREAGGDAVVEIDSGQQLEPQFEAICPTFFDSLANTPVPTEPSFYVYRPDASTTSTWPDHCVPLVVFSPAAGGNAVVEDTHVYAHVFDRLAEQGFLVVATNSNGSSESGSGVATTRERANLAECAVEWARDEYADFVGPDLAFVGHSRGGAAISALAPAFLEDGLKAAVAIAPALSSGEEGDLQPGPTDPAEAVPYLVIQGNNDEDTEGAGISNYDFMAVEDPSHDHTISDYVYDKAILWPYDARHFVFGGQYHEFLNPSWYADCTDGDCIELDRGRAIAGFYIPAFLSWKVYGDVSLRHWFVDPTAHDADASAFPQEVREVDMVDVWEGLYSQDQFEVLGERPVMLAAFSQGVGDPGTERLRIDTMSRPLVLACNDPDQEEIFSPSEPLSATVTELGLEDVCISEASNQSITWHETSTMDLPWREASQGAEVRWNLMGELPGEDGLLPYTNLSVRLGKRRVGVGTTADPIAVEFVLETEALDDAGTFMEAIVPYDRVINQGYEGQAIATTFLHTTRVPIADFAFAQMPDLTRPRALALRVPDPSYSEDASSHIHVDSLELVHHPLDGARMDPSPDAFWRCEATSNLAAQETICLTTPQNGACPQGYSDVDFVALPQVAEDGGSFNGWVVGTHPGWIEDPDDPTGGELSSITSRCRAACRREYEGLEHVSANCDAGSVFETPTRFEEEAVTTRRSIPGPYRNGAGIWFNDVLGCDLLDDCAGTAFDEDLWPTAPMRVTEARSQLGRGEEWVVDVVGEIKTQSLEDSTNGQADIVGTVGWTFCKDGNTGAECPFYVGSAHFESTEQMLLNLHCNGGWLQRPVDVFELDLLQPAMGMHTQNSIWVAFPPGAMVSQMHAESGPFAMDVAAPNANPVYINADDDDIQLQATGGLEIVFDYNCNGDIKPIKAWLRFDSSTTQDGPPSIAIDMPSSVSCSTSVPLDVDVTDPDSDAGTVRWEVDGVLLDTSVTSITVTESYDIVAIVRDARGATATDTHTISCT